MDGSYQDIANVTQAEHDDALADAQRRLAKFGARAEFWRMTSLEAAAKIEDATMDFVYLDARHDHESVMEDLAAWYPKLKTGGIFAGHDYVAGDFPAGVFGVRSAVDEFFAGKDTAVYDTYAEPFWPTWIVAPRSPYPRLVGAARTGLRLGFRVRRKVEHLHATRRWR